MTPTSQDPTLERARDRSDTALQLLIVVLTFLTAAVALLAARADDAAAALRLEGQRTLSEANAIEASADRFVAEQFRLYDEYNVAEPGSFEEEYYEAQLDLLVLEGADRNRESDIDGYPFDDAFFVEAYADADDALDESDEIFERSAAKGDLAVGYRATLVTITVALSFAAWGSLAHSRDKRRHRAIFLTLSLVVLAGGLAQGALTAL